MVDDQRLEPATACACSPTSSSASTKSSRARSRSVSSRVASPIAHSASANSSNASPRHRASASHSRLTALRRSAVRRRLRHHLLEHRRVQLAGSDLQRIAARARHQPVTIDAEQSAQLVDRALHPGHGVRVVVPHVAHDPIGRHDPPLFDQQQPHQRPTLGPAQLDRPVAPHHLEASQHPKLHRRTLPRPRLDARRHDDTSEFRR